MIPVELGIAPIAVMLTQSTKAKSMNPKRNIKAAGKHIHAQAAAAH